MAWAGSAGWCYNPFAMVGLQLGSSRAGIHTRRLSRRRLLSSALLAASGLATAAFLSCDEQETRGAQAPPARGPATATPRGETVSTFDSNGVPIHYEVFGEGRPIVLVHGFAANLEANWVNTGWIDTLTPIRQVVGLDARGHGLSGKPHDPQAYAGDQMQNDVLRLMDHLGILRADLFGYSMGAQISLRLLLLHPDRFTAVALGGVGDFVWRRPGDSSDGFGARVSEALLAEDPSTIMDPVAKAFRLFAEALNNDLEALAAYMRSPRTRVHEADLSQVSRPVLIVNGEADTVAGSPDELAAAIPGARLVKVPERDHLTVVPDQRFKEAVVEFLTEQSSA